MLPLGFAQVWCTLFRHHWILLPRGANNSWCCIACFSLETARWDVFLKMIYRLPTTNKDSKKLISVLSCQRRYIVSGSILFVWDNLIWGSSPTLNNQTTLDETKFRQEGQCTPRVSYSDERYGMMGDLNKMRWNVIRNLETQTQSS